jgi:hypothetical protein
MNSLAATLPRVALLVLLLWTVLAQVLVFEIASEQGRSFPDVAHLVVPYSVAGVLATACVQVGLLAVWRLLSLVERGVIFSHGALPWVDVITACAAVATVLDAAPLIHLLLVVRVGGPLILWLPAPLAGGLAVVSLMRVVRGVLESGIAERMGQRPPAPTAVGPR